MIESELPGRFDPRVKEAMARVPRHLFVPAAQQPYAYENRPLPIGHGQTISQPYIIALVEVRTGGGYEGWEERAQHPVPHADRQAARHRLR